MALRALKALLQTVYAEAESQEDISQDKASRLAQKLCDTCLLELKEADKSNATPATKILSAAVSASGRYSVSQSVCANRLTDIPCDRLAGGVHRTTDIWTATQ
jgi:hypothetical protein